MSDKEVKIKITTEADAAKVVKLEKEIVGLEKKVAKAREEMVKFEPGAKFDGAAQDVVDYTAKLVEARTALERVGKSGETAAGDGGKGIGKVGGEMKKLRQVGSEMKKLRQVASNVSPGLAKFLNPMTAGVAAASAGLLLLRATLLQVGQRGAEFWERMGKREDAGESLQRTKVEVDEVKLALDALAAAQKAADDAGAGRAKIIDEEAAALSRKVDMVSDLTKAQIDLAVQEGKLTEEQGDAKKLAVDGKAGDESLAVAEEARARKLALKQAEAVRAAEVAAKLAADAAAAKEAAGARSGDLADPNLRAARRQSQSEERRIERAAVPDADNLTVAEKIALAAKVRFDDMFNGKIFDVLPSPNEMLEKGGFDPFEGPLAGGLTKAQQESLDAAQEETKVARARESESVEAERARREVQAQELDAAAKEAAAKAEAAKAEAAEMERKNAATDRQAREEQDLKTQIEGTKAKTRSVAREQAAAVPVKGPVAVPLTPEQQAYQQTAGLAGSFAGAASGSTYGAARQGLQGIAKKLEDGSSKAELVELNTLLTNMGQTMVSLTGEQKAAIEDLKRTVAAVQSQLANNAGLRE